MNRKNRRAFLKTSLLLGSAGLQSSRLLSVSRQSAVPKTRTGNGILEKVQDFDVYRDPDYYCGPGPSAVVFPDGEILVGFRRAPADAHTHMFLDTEACLISSRDNGKSWTKPRVIDYGGVHNINLTLLRDGTLLYATSLVQPITKGAYERVKDLPQIKMKSGRRRLAFSAEDWKPWKISEQGVQYAMEMGVCVRRSTDRGQTWSPQFWISPIPGVSPLLPNFPAPTELRSPVVELRDGTLVIPIYSFPNPWRPLLMQSKDGGRTWSLRGEIVGPDDHLQSDDSEIGPNETVVHETDSTRLVAFVRNEGFLVTTTSHDGGKTWLDPHRHKLWGYPYATLRMPSGRVLLAYGYRREPFGIRARLLDSECAGIDDAQEIVVRDDGGMRDLGYPLGTLMTDGSALLVYYFNSHKDGGQQVYIAGSILQEV